MSSFATLVHVSVATASRWETGRRRPHTEDVDRIAAVLRCDRHDLLSWVREQPRLSTDAIRRPTNLRSLRQANGLSRRQLAEGLRVSTATVAHWECARRGLPVSRIPALADVLGVEPSAVVSALRAPASGADHARLLVQLRRRAGLTQRQAATRVGVSDGTISAWERGVRQPTWPHARRLADAYRCELGQVARAVGLCPPANLNTTSLVAGNLPAVLRDIRAWRGTSLRQVAADANVNWQTLRRWEAGLTSPNRGTLPRIEAALGLAPGSLRCV